MITLNLSPLLALGGRAGLNPIYLFVLEYQSIVDGILLELSKFTLQNKIIAY